MLIILTTNSLRTHIRTSPKNKNILSHSRTHTHTSFPPKNNKRTAVYEWIPMLSNAFLPTSKNPPLTQQSTPCTCSFTTVPIILLVTRNNSLSKTRKKDIKPKATTKYYSKEQKHENETKTSFQWRNDTCPYIHSMYGCAVHWLYMFG